MTYLIKLAERCEAAETWVKRGALLDHAPLADRIEYGRNAWGDWCLDALCRELEGVDPKPNCNGICADYLRNLQEAKRLIPANHLFSVCHDTNEVRAVVALQLTERGCGFSAVPHGPYAEERSLVAAALRARAGDG